MGSNGLRRARSVGDWIGRQPAALMLAGTIALLLLATLILPAGAHRVAGLVLLAAFAIYCALRPTQRADAFFISCAPAAASAMMAPILGISRGWIAWPVLAVTLLVLWDLDRESREPEPEPQPSA